MPDPPDPSASSVQALSASKGPVLSKAEGSDRALALQARQGNADAFGELVRRYQSLVFNVC